MWRPSSRELIVQLPPLIVREAPAFIPLKDSEASALRAPLPKEEGGLGLCLRNNPDGTQSPIFLNKEDPDYQTILRAATRAHDYLLNENQHFSLRVVRPNPAYTKAMIKYGILPKDFDLNQPYDVYETDRKYWRSFELLPNQNSEGGK